MAVEYAPSVQDPTIRAHGPELFSPPSESNPQIPYLTLSERIASEWRPLLGKEEGNPSRRLEVFRETAIKFSGLISEMTASELDGDMSEEQAAEVAKRSSYVKITVEDLANPLQIDVASFVESKMMEKMQEKYPPDAVYELITLGMAPLEAMAHLKSIYMDPDKEPYQLQGVSIPWEDEVLRLPRIPSFGDANQDIADTWQRRAFGKYLRASERLPNALGEMQELSDEFNGMSPEQVNELTSYGKLVVAPKEGEIITDPVLLKLISIGYEMADVKIGLDGYVSAIGRDQEEDTNAALDRQIGKYKKTKKLLRRGLDEEGAMKLQHEIADRRSRGLKLPFINIPAAATLFIR